MLESQVSVEPVSIIYAILYRRVWFSGMLLILRLLMCGRKRGMRLLIPLSKSGRYLSTDLYMSGGLKLISSLNGIDKDQVIGMPFR